MAFLAFEGIDGCGKSTLIAKLQAYLQSKGTSVYLTREPGGTPLAEEIRELIIRRDGEAPNPRAEILLYEAARSQHVEKVIKPQLSEGVWVLSDRFTASSLAFQAGGRGLDEDSITYLNNYAVNGCQPDFNVLLDLTVEGAEKRRQTRTHESGQQPDRFEVEEQDFHNRVRDHYLMQAKESPSHWIVLEARFTPEEIFNNLLTQLRLRSWLD